MTERVTTPRPIETGDDGEETPSRLSRGMWGVIAFLSTSTFAAGLATGILVDGTAEVVNEFNAKNQRSCAPTRADPTIIVAPAGAAPAGSPPAPASAPAHPNNDVSWLISVAPGTSTQRVEVRNGDSAKGARVEFGSADGRTISKTATMWIDPSSTATIALPLGRYVVRAQPLDASQTPSGPIIPVPGTVGLDQPTGLAIIAGTPEGVWQAAGDTRTEKTNRPKPVRKRKPQSDEEYRGLGRDSEDGGSSTYG